MRCAQCSAPQYKPSQKKSPDHRSPLGQSFFVPARILPTYHQPSASMAKSTRSKVKRAFRAKKRTEGVYAATEAARLQRLNTKLRALTATTVVVDDDEDGDNPKKEGEEEERDGQDQDARMSGSFWFAAFGLIDHLDVSPAAMHQLGLGHRVPHYLRHSISGHFFD